MLEREGGGVAYIVFSPQIEELTAQASAWVDVTYLCACDDRCVCVCVCVHVMCGRDIWSKHTYDCCLP